MGTGKPSRGVFPPIVQAIVVLIVLSACASGSGTPARTGAAPSSQAADQVPAGGQRTDGQVAAGQRWDDIVAAAQKEGVVVMAGPPAAAIRDGLNAFTEKYKIQVDYLAGQEGQHYARIEPEFAAGKLTVDLYLGGPNVPILRMSPNHMLDPLKPTLLLPEVGCGNWQTTDSCPWFLDPDEQYILKLGNYLSGAVYVNTKNVDPASLTSWEDLLTPRFKRRMVAHDPAPPGGSGTATARWLILIKGEDFVRRLYKDQEITISANTAQVAEWLARGSHDVAVGASPSSIAPLLAKGLPIQAVPLAGAPLNISGGFLGAMARLKNAPHPNAATVLTNWLLTRDGAEMLGRATDIAITRNDTTNDWMYPWQLPSPNGEYVDASSWEYLTKTGPELDVIRERLFKD